MGSPPVRYAVLRDRRVWDGVILAGLQAEPDGVLTLARVPGTGDGNPIIYPPPYSFAPSGLALGEHHDIYLAETDQQAVSWLMGGCGDTKVVLGSDKGAMPGQLDSPRGLAVSRGSLYLADSGNGRVLVFRLPTLELRAIWKGVLQEPTCLASDSEGRIYVLDHRLPGVLRFDVSGVPDAAYNAAMSQLLQSATPVALAIGGDDVLYLSDQQSNSVLRFDLNGQALAAPPHAGAPIQPRALATRDERLYVADEATGWIRVYHAGQGWVGQVPDYRGPVAAMTLDRLGGLYIKPGPDANYHSLGPDAAYASLGTLTAGPLDAGLEATWVRVHVEAEGGSGSEVELRLYPADSDATPPSETDWASPATLAPALDALVPPLPGSPSSTPGKRYLWLRIALRASDSRRAPRLLQVEAATGSESYLQFLPEIYGRADTRNRFLERFLALFQARLGDWERRLESVPRRFDPVTAPAKSLPWLARWLALELPHDQDGAHRRTLLKDAHRLYQGRGTPFGIREFCEVYAGVRPSLIEAFPEQQVWQLGQTSSLGFDTVLAAASPDGMVLPGFTNPDPAFAGLRGDYYNGSNFEQLKLTRIDATVDFDWKDQSPVEEVLPQDAFSVRWTGQLRPLHSELYTFHTTSDDGVRLFVDGRLIIDSWTEHPATEDRGTMALAADRWYPITLEYYEKTGVASISLAWSSRSQIREIIPAQCLYAIVDETTGAGSSTGETMLVGQVVVGASGPLARADFGKPLFADTALLFTVLLPAARLPTLAEREELRRVVEAEKPVHTDFHLCFIDPHMRVGFQARLGIDSIVAGAPPPMSLSGAVLGRDSYLGDNDETDGTPTGRVGKHAHVGHDAIVG
jgi:phage tail-like protein